MTWRGFIMPPSTPDGGTEPACRRTSGTLSEGHGHHPTPRLAGQATCPVKHVIRRARTSAQVPTSGVRTAPGAAGVIEPVLSEMTSSPCLSGQLACLGHHRCQVAPVQPGTTETVQFHQPQSAFRLADIHHEDRIGSPPHLAQHPLGKGADFFRAARRDVARPAPRVLTCRDDAVADDHEPPLGAERFRGCDHDQRLRVVAGRGERGRKAVASNPPADEQFVTTGRAREDLIVVAEFGEQGINLSDRLDTRQDGMVLVEQELLEVSEIDAAIEVLGVAPGARNPGVMKLNLACKGERPVPDNATLGRERLTLDDRRRTFLQRLVRNDFSRHSLPTDLGQERIRFGAVHTSLDQPDRTHRPILYTCTSSLRGLAVNASATSSMRTNAWCGPPSGPRRRSPGVVFSMTTATPTPRLSSNAPASWLRNTAVNENFSYPFAPFSAKRGWNGAEANSRTFSGLF